MSLRRTLHTFIAMVLALGASSHAALGQDAGTPLTPTQQFAAEVDLSPLDRVAVQWEGRVKSFYSLAHETVGRIVGPRGLPHESHAFVYLDLMLRPSAYADAPLIYVKNKSMRSQIGQTLVNANVVDEAWRENFIKRGQISRTLLMRDDVQAQMEVFRRDLIRTAKFVNQIDFALYLAQPSELMNRMRVLPPQDATSADLWMSIETLMNRPVMEELTGVPIQPELRNQLQTHWGRLMLAWGQMDAQTVNAELEAFVDLLPQIAPDVYPETRRLEAESWYFKYGSMTWGWLIYLLASMFLLMSVAYRWNKARWIGLGIFGVAFGVHTAALLMRWWISGRWPNSNMFEAVTTAVWFGAVVALLLEFVARRSAMRNLFALTAACASMAALMAARYLPQLDPNISNMMPILHDIWLYIHTNVIIASYAVIAMASVTGILYIIWRMFGGSPDYARVGGAAVLFERGSRGMDVESRRVSPGEVFDGATMILLELAVVMLWAGLIMGAIWADHSWGRPWGWDPKEVFALNTFIIFLILVHIRLKVKDKGMWTAVLAILGCGVMLFNWIVINFIITGLHSYA
ncbi:MAG: cytochrome c biogenesis protein CcsA [Phycisphaerales bacterium]